MTNVTQHYTETITYPKQVQFTVANRHASGFSKDGGKTRIDVPKHKRILNEDRVVLTEAFVKLFNEIWGSEYLFVSDGVVSTINKVVIGSIGTVAYKRYIKGENSIWKVEQEKMALKPTKNDEIFMLWGDYMVDSKNKPTDKGLLVFLLTHNGNADFELRDASISAAAFKINDTRRNAAIELDDKDDKVQEARDIVYQVRDIKTKRFNKDKMQFYTNVFRTQISGYDSDEEKFKALLYIADNNPDMIINGVNQENVNYLQVVQQAIGLDILVREKGKFQNTLTGNTVVTFKVGTTEELAIEKIVSYYASQDGANEFDHLKNSVEAKKMSITN